MVPITKFPNAIVTVVNEMMFPFIHCFNLELIYRDLFAKVFTNYDYDNTDYDYDYDNTEKSWNHMNIDRYTMST